MTQFDPFDDYEIIETPATLEEVQRPAAPRPKRRKPAGRDRLYVLISNLFFGATALVLITSVLFIVNPAAVPAPLRPALVPTPTIILLPGVNAPIVEPTNADPGMELTAQAIAANPSPTLPLVATHTPIPSPTGAGPVLNATNTPAIFPFTLQDEAITYTENQNELGCDWLSIAGQVFDQDGNPVTGLPVQIIGDQFEGIQFTGSATLFGPSGYEVFLNESPVEAEFEVRLLSTTGRPLSEPIIVRTIDDCERNVAIANFVQNRDYTR